MLRLHRLMYAFFLLVSFAAVSHHTRQEGCRRVQEYSDAVELHVHGETWAERCRSCACRQGQVTCSLNPTAQPCPRHYDPSHDAFCLQWSEDGCCCMRLGCLREGKMYDFGEEYTVPSVSSDCVTRCVCAPFMESCVTGPC